MLKLSHIRPLVITKGRVGVHDPHVTQVLEGHEVLVLPEAVEVAAAECEGAKVAVDGGKELLGPGQPQGYMTHLVRGGGGGGGEIKPRGERRQEGAALVSSKRIVRQSTRRVMPQE